MISAVSSDGVSRPTRTWPTCQTAASGPGAPGRAARPCVLWLSTPVFIISGEGNRNTRMEWPLSFSTK